MQDSLTLRLPSAQQKSVSKRQAASLPAGNSASHATSEPRDSAPRILERNTDVSGFLSEVTATLIAKEPKDRFESASFLETVVKQ